MKPVRSCACVCVYACMCVGMCEASLAPRGNLGEREKGEGEGRRARCLRRARADYDTSQLASWAGHEPWMIFFLLLFPFLLSFSPSSFPPPSTEPRSLLFLSHSPVLPILTPLLFHPILPFASPPRATTPLTMLACGLASAGRELTQNSLPRDAHRVRGPRGGSE
ncbi:hypothetical protein GGS23DRAFT_267921 [Durotheca rogersii]|uniref:uncharacterized protein n=1 Tax=Durotheca rogersii TaxID=419775 RepID=UPI00221FB894|nr:uncharacterized protein GGS23DRAFT_267921 [Durotheca rogersii]KAI5859731.1 hypothetical protein GGS23DRAFT_267921 [Durotheca rogersii]